MTGKILIYEIREIVPVAVLSMVLHALYIINILHNFKRCCRQELQMNDSNPLIKNCPRCVRVASKREKYIVRDKKGIESNQIIISKSIKSLFSMGHVNHFSSL